MPIVVFWLDAQAQAGARLFSDAQLLDALAFSESCRREGLRHVCLSSELADSVGAPGVQAVESGCLPNGERYEFSKAHRGAGPASKG